MTPYVKYLQLITGLILLLEYKLTRITTSIKVKPDGQTCEQISNTMEQCITYLPLFRSLNENAYQNDWIYCSSRYNIAGKQYFQKSMNFKGC